MSGTGEGEALTSRTELDGMREEARRRGRLSSESLAMAEELGLDDLIALWTARDPEELWRALVVYPGRSTTDHREAVYLFRRQHEDGTPGALTTALLLCTDGRWDRCTARLIVGIAESSILSEDDLDELGGSLLWPDRFSFQYPVSWIGTKWVGIDLDGGSEAAERSVMHLDPTTPVPTMRYIAPPLRRWSAARMLRTDPSTFGAMRTRALELGGLDGGAIVSGMLDAIRAVHKELARQAIDLGLAWPRGSVRLVALDLLAAHDPEAARRLAAADPDRKVRRWIADRAGKGVGSASREVQRPGTGQRGRHDPHLVQAELFLK